MKFKTLIAILCMNLPLIMMGQNEVDLGIFLGYGEHGSDVHSWGRHGAMITENSAFAWGANLKYNVKPAFGLRLNYWRSKISGQDETIELPGHLQRGFSFTSPISELSLVAEYDFLGKRRWIQNDKDDSKNMEVTTNRFRKMITPYIFGGIGMSFTQPEVNFNGRANTEINNDISNTENTNFQIPIGIGVRYDISEVIYLSAEASSRVPLTDYLEGISESANPDRNDSYQFIGLNLGFRLGANSDSDKDGISDAKDLCPEVPGLEIFSGCPDSDADGIQDKLDSCPNTPGLTEFQGCPDTDQDGIQDSVDDCPEIAGIKSLDGCPDSDGDGIADAKDNCPNEAGIASNNGCPEVQIKDSDNDGFLDDVDPCPNLAGSVNGCPDSDGDGFSDNIDPCPSVKGIINGCPDSDNDGLPDNLDDCPNRYGSRSNNGCPASGPVTTTTPSTSNALFIDDIYFDTNRSIIKDQYRYRIDEAATYAKNNPQAELLITGHADARDTDDFNLNLSQKRAEAVYQALVKKGIPPSRLTIQYVGENKPAADNQTQEGLARNRRVEIRASNN